MYTVRPSYMKNLDLLNKNKKFLNYSIDRCTMLNIIINASAFRYGIYAYSANITFPGSDFLSSPLNITSSNIILIRVPIDY